MIAIIPGISRIIGVYVYLMGGKIAVGIGIAVIVIIPANPPPPGIIEIACGFTTIYIGPTPDP
jgi:hypothetical protein